MATETNPAAAATSKTGSATGAAKGAAEPIIVDIGKKDRKDIRALRKGKPGKLMRRIEETIAHLHDNGALAAEAQPIIIVVRERPKRKSRQLAKLWGLA